MAILVIQTASRIGAHHGGPPRWISGWTAGWTSGWRRRGSAWTWSGIARVIQGRIAVRGAARVSTSPVERARYAGWSAAWYGRWNPRNPTRTRSAVRLRGSPVESRRLKQHADGHELANTLGR